ncbi:MAG: cell division protein SepF [Syntrophomonadaceae bacterium]|jgi:cell division inhibitor SepF
MGKLNKFWNWLGVEQEEIREEIIEMPAAPEDSIRGISNVVSIHTNKTMKVVVCEPESFDEVQMLADHLKNRKQVILNFENTPKDLSQRILDFLSGTTYALEGNSQQLGHDIFIFTPSNVEIARDARSIMRKHGFGSIFGGDR